MSQTLEPLVCEKKRGEMWTQRAFVTLEIAVESIFETP